MRGEQLNTIADLSCDCYPHAIMRTTLATGLLCLALAGCTAHRSGDAPPADPGILTNDASLEEYVRAFGAEAALREAKRLSAGPRECHDAAHKIGRFSYRIFGENGFTLSLPDCQSGVTHGLMEEFFKERGTDALRDSLESICPQGNEFLRGQCFHGIGHGLLGWTDYDLPYALALCDELPVEAARSPCRSGVFMENRLGLLARGGSHASAYLSDDPQFPCSVVKDHQKPECYFGQADHMARLFSGDFAKVSAACENAPSAYQELCFNGMGRTVFAFEEYDASAAIAACSRAHATQNQVACVAGAVQETFWVPGEQEEGLAFCAQEMPEHLKDSCYGMLAERAAQLLTRSEHADYCTKFPEERTESCVAARPGRSLFLPWD